MRQRSLILGLLPLMLLAARAPARERPAPTGLKLLSTTLEPPTSEDSGRTVALTVQNVSNKTIVAVAALFFEFRADGTPTYALPDDAAHGVGMDFDGPDFPDHNNWIKPGQITTIRLFATGNIPTASVKATITGLVYEDQTGEGPQAQMFFQQRLEKGQRAREAAAQEKSPGKRRELEKRAEWYETHLEVER